MSWSVIGILTGIFALGFCAGNIFQIFVRPKEEEIREVTLNDFIRSKHRRRK